MEDFFVRFTERGSLWTITVLAKHRAVPFFKITKFGGKYGGLLEKLIINRKIVLSSPEIFDYYKNIPLQFS